MALKIVFLCGILLISGAAQAQRPAKFRPIRGEKPPEPQAAESLYTTPSGGKSSSVSDRPTPVSDSELIESFDPRSQPNGGGAQAPPLDETADPTRYFEDLPGTSVAGIPRVIRDNAGTEIFFTNLNQSYVIAQDNLHNRKFKIFTDAIKSGASVSFKADPYSRRILEVDGVDQASAAPKPKKSPASTAAPTSSRSAPAGKK
jgi:hypothetical protein